MEKGGSGMVENTGEAQTMKKKKLPFVAVLGIGCIVIVAISLLAFGIAFAAAGKFVLSSFGQGLLKKTIEQKTGVSLDVGKNGEKFSITNQQTGESVTLGEDKIPANFPKDFPLYLGVTPKGTAVGLDQSAGKGFWLLLESTDPLATVTSYYDEQLSAKGWTVEESNSLGDGTMYRVKKEKLTGTVILSMDTKNKKTTILVTLEPTNEQNPAPQEVAPEGAEPVEDLGQ